MPRHFWLQLPWSKTRPGIADPWQITRTKIFHFADRFGFPISHCLVMGTIVQTNLNKNVGEIRPNKKGYKMKRMNRQTSHALKMTLATATTSARSIAAALAVSLAMAVGAPSASAGPGDVLPPTATPLGWSLDEMASAVANFSISGNDPAYYPDTPFQIIYRHPGNAFTVKSGTYFYVNVVFFDDSPPIIGDWPADKSGAADYVFGRDQLGGHDLAIEVDGKVTSLDEPGYIALADTPTSPDGSAHILKIAAFLTPLSKGTHAVTIRGVFDGDAILEAFGGPFVGRITYSVTVE